MKHTHTALVVMALVLAFAGFVQAADTDPVTVTGILKAAGAPLTDAQQKTIAGIQPGGDMRSLMTTVNGMFTDPQLAALKAKLGTTPARGNMAESPRNLTQVLILEIAKAPLTEGQLATLNAAAAQPPQAGQGAPSGQTPAGQAGQGGRGGMGMGGINAVLTDAQREAMTKYMGAGMGGGQGGRGQGGEGGAGGGRPGGAGQ